MTAKILAFAGSLRVESFNKKLIRLAAEAALAAGAEVTLLDLRDLPLPLYDGDLEAREGLPENARKIKDLMLAHQGFLISCPEYNSSITGVLKNTIDWASRPAPGEPRLACFTNKVVGLMSASPGALGGLRGLVHVRAILGNIHSIVIPHQFTLSHAHEAFNPDGSLKEDHKHHAVADLAARVVEFVRKLHPFEQT